MANQQMPRRTGRLSPPTTVTIKTLDETPLPHSSRNQCAQGNGPSDPTRKIFQALHWLVLTWRCKGLSPRDPRLRHPRYRRYFPPEVLHFVLGEEQGSKSEIPAKPVAPEEYRVTVTYHSSEDDKPHTHRSKLLHKTDGRKRSPGRDRKTRSSLYPSTKLRIHKKHFPDEGKCSSVGRKSILVTRTPDGSAKLHHAEKTS